MPHSPTPTRTPPASTHPPTRDGTPGGARLVSKHFAAPQRRLADIGGQQAAAAAGGGAAGSAGQRRSAQVSAGQLQASAAGQCCSREGDAEQHTKLNRQADKMLATHTNQQEIPLPIHRTAS